MVAILLSYLQRSYLFRGGSCSVAPGPQVQAFVMLLLTVGDLNDSALEWPPLAQCSYQVSWKLVKWFKSWHWRTHALHGVTFLLLKRSSKLIKQQSISMNVEGEIHLFATRSLGFSASRTSPPPPPGKNPPVIAPRLLGHPDACQIITVTELSCSLGVPSNPFHIITTK